jgi:hypothetical protein
VELELVEFVRRLVAEEDVRRELVHDLVVVIGLRGLARSLVAGLERVRERVAMIARRGAVQELLVVVVEDHRAAHACSVVPLRECNRTTAQLAQ